MLYTIEFDLDYDTHPGDEVRAVGNALRAALLRSGFRADGRRFRINRPPHLARQLARQTMEEVAQRLARQGRSLYRYIRDFYGYPSTCADNLLLPPTDTIEVRNVAV
jgi:hypothetical protein